MLGLYVKELVKHYEINASIEKVWKAFTVPQEIDAWGGGPAVMDDKVGTQFKLWDGDIHGTNTEIELCKKIVQEWYSGDWPEPSIAEFTFSQKNGKTIIDLLHKNIPDMKTEEIDKGWDEYYLGPLKKLAEEQL